MGSRNTSLNQPPCGASVLLGCAALFLASCATPNPVLQISPSEQRRHDQKVGLQLADEFEKRIEIRSAAQVSEYLDRLAQVLSAQDVRLSESATKVLLIRDVKGLWRNFALPGNRVYLSLSLLKTIEFENELAAALAFELAHLAERTVLSRTEDAPRERGSAESSARSPREPRDTQEFFSFSEESDRKAAQGAVGLLYRAGFDPRGLSSLWGRYGRSRGRSPYDGPRLSTLLETTRQAIAERAPLRNPVVRSRAFLEAEKRIRKL